MEAGVKGYVYLEPLRHVEHWSDFTPDELIEMSTLVPRIEQALCRLLSVDRLYMVVISEAVRHLHLHLIPRHHHEQEKGLALITRATQHRSEIDTLVRMEYNEFYDKLQNLLTSEN
jgi:diadenosine tetraphosphate (Ap4A) HIT family hydrolase